MKINKQRPDPLRIAHSLACGLISAALSDHGMNVAHATLIDAAIPREVFDGRAGSGTQLSGEESGMTPAIWRNYDLRLQSPSWHERFAAVSGDKRQTLTWRNRFIGAVPSVHNFYSSTEDVLGSYDGEVPSTSLGAAAVVVTNGAAFTAYVWVYQEKAKGNRQDYYLPFLGSFHAGSTYMGWGMNLKDPLLSGDPTHWKWVNSYDYIGRMIKTSAEIGAVSDSVLRRHPVFEPGWGVVRNQEQQEIPGAHVSLGFKNRLTSEDVFVRGQTDADGRFTGEGGAGPTGVSNEITNEGYYQGWAPIPKFYEVDPLNHWKPWNETYTTTLRRIGKPVPLYAKTLRKLEIPVLGQPCGYDLEASDWVAPWGKGKPDDARPKSRVGHDKEPDPQFEARGNFSRAVTRAQSPQSAAMAAHVAPALRRASEPSRRLLPPPRR